MDRSESGLGLLLRDDVALPDQFDIETSPQGRRRVEVVWRANPRYGVVFRDGATPGG